MKVFGQPNIFGNAFGQGVGGDVQQTLAQLLATFNPLIWYEYNIASGTNIANAGSLGSGDDGTLALGNGTLSQAGCTSETGIQFAGNEAVAGNRTIVTATGTGVGDYADLGAYTVMVQFVIDSVPSAPCIFRVGSFLWYMPSVVTSWIATRPSSGTAPNTVCQNIVTEGSAALAAGNCYLAFLTYENVTLRKFRMYFAKQGDSAVTPATDYAADAAATGTLTAVEGTTFGWGARVTTITNAFHGEIFRTLWFPSVLSTDNMNAILAAA